MIEKILGFSLRNRGPLLLLVLVLAVWGVISFLRLPIDAFPDVTNIQVEILSSAPGRAPLEVEKFVTFPLETAMRGLPDLADLRSVSKFGLSVITAVFKDSTDIYFARQLVLERLIEAKEAVPEGVTISLGPVATAMGEIYQYTIAAPVPAGEDEIREELTRQRSLQDWTIAPILKSVPGVNEINSFGGYIRQYQVVVDPDLLIRHGRTLSEVILALERDNRNVGGNILELHDRQYLIRGVGLMASTEDIGQTAITSVGGVPVLVRDVARVVEGQAVRQGASVINGEREVVGGIVMMLRGENSREVVARVEAKVAEINAGGLLPAGWTLESFYRRSDIVRASIHTISDALLLGAVFVIFVLTLFLRSLRSAVIVVLAMPLAILAAFIAMKQLGITANLMSLGGLAISIGMIVDATIIQVENVQRHLTEGGPDAPRLSTVLKAVIEVRKPSIFGEAIIIITFLPILTLQGIEGKMFIPLALTLSLALLAALLLSIFVSPVLCFVLLKPGAPGKTRSGGFLARRLHRPILLWALGHKVPVLAFSALFLCGGAWLVPRLGTEFLPVMDEGAFDMDIQFVPGISLEKSVEMSLLVQRELKKFPELLTIVSRTGQTGIAIEARGVEKTGYVGSLRPRSEWTSARTREELTGKMRDAVAHIPGMSFGFSQPIACRIDEIVSGTRAQIIVKLFGDDLEVLKAKADEIGEVLASVPGAVDLNLERISGQPTIVIVADRLRAARHGLGVGDVQDIVETAVGGRAVSRIYEGDRAFDLVVRYPEERRSSPGDLERILIPTPAGYRVPLGEVADVVTTEGPVQVSREFGRRRIGVECNVVGRDIGGFVAEAKAAIAGRVDLPEGYFLDWGGQFENQERARARLAVIVPAALGLILLLLFLSFGSLRPALIVMANLPFALVGGVLALIVSGMYLSVPASVGFIALLGIAVLNGVVIVSFVLQAREAGLTPVEAALQAGEKRLRPVLMTALTTVFGLVPMLFAQGPGSEVQRPLAVVVVGGLVTSTLLTLVLLPSFTAWFGTRRRRTGRPGA